MKRIMMLALLAGAVGCGTVSAAGADEAHAGTAGSAGGGPEAGSGGAAPDGGAGSAARAGAGAVVADGGWAAPVLRVAWTITDLDTLAPATCADLGITQVEVRVKATGGTQAGFPVAAAMPCADGGGTVDLPLGAAGVFFTYEVDLSASTFTDARAAWSRTAPVAAAYAPGCGAVVSGAPFQLVVGAPPSCAPCAAATTCCGTHGQGSCASSASGQPETFTGTCEGAYGDARTAAIAACTSFTAQVCPSN